MLAAHKRDLEELISAHMAAETGWPETAKEISDVFAAPAVSPFSAEEASKIASGLLGRRKRATPVRPNISQANQCPREGRGSRFDMPEVTNLWGVSETRFETLIPIVRQAYADIRRDWAVDRVIADPELNELFLRRCWELGAHASPFDLNRALMNARKSNKLTAISPSRRSVIPREVLDQYSYGCEFVLRHLQERHFARYRRIISVDTILCDPQLAATFDELAARIVPDRSSFEYRWSILSIRKRGRSNARTTLPGRFCGYGDTRQLKTKTLPNVPGIYWLHSEGEELFFGHTANLRAQIESLFERHGPIFVPDWLIERQCRSLELAVLRTPSKTHQERDALVVDAASSLSARLNYLGAVLPSAA